MLSWEQIVEQYIVKYTNQIRKTTQPLRDHFGIDYFTYHRIDNLGQYTVLVDRPDWAETYVSEKVYLNDPYLRHPRVYRSGLCFIENHGSDEYKSNIIRLGKQVLKMDTAITLIQKNDQFVEFFGFSGTKENSALENLYLNHPQLLKSFANHFKEKLNPILTHMRKEEDCPLLKLKGNDFLCEHPIFPDMLPNKHLEFLKDIGKGAEIEKFQSLTAREKQCLKLLIQDKSAKETAAFLGLSVRTIEFYFENIKNKLNCWNKQEILAIAKDFQSLGLI